MKIKRYMVYLKRNGIKATIARVMQKLSGLSGVTMNMNEIVPLNARADDCLGDRKRLNLVIHAVGNESFFGGVATALSFFQKLYSTIDIDARVILTNSYISAGRPDALKGFEITDARSGSSAPLQMMSVIERDDDTFIPVGKNDIFIATAWWTAYIIYPLIKWQRETFNEEPHPLIYLIQDYEPGFYPWSSKYLLADSTYKNGHDTIAVFNSKFLHEFFKGRGYAFKHEYFFEPVLNETLRSCLLAAKPSVRKQQIIIYGRPSVARNAFEVIVASLRLWAKQQPDIHKWSILSVGEKHANIVLAKGAILRSIGKLTLEDYASLMLESYMGISLMVSPHPSYPPLEMSTFGVRTITNRYDNKDLSGFNENIISLDNVNEYSISLRLTHLATLYPGDAKPVTDTPYVRDAVDNNQIQEICKEIKGTIDAKESDNSV